MARLYDTGIFSANATDGSIGVGYKLYFYTTGTTTPKNTYPTRADALAETNPNANPVVAAADGRWAPIWLTDGDYKVILKDFDDVTLETRDPADDDVSGQLAAATGAGLIGYSYSASYSAGTVGHKLQEVKSVLDFGAVGDCTAVSTGTDDAAAIQLAFDWLVGAAYRKIVFPAGYRWRVSATCTANWAGVYGGQVEMLSPVTPDPAIGNAFEFIDANMVELKLWVLDGGQTAVYSARDPSGADQAFYIRGVRGGIISYQGHNYKGRVMRCTKERTGEPKTSRLTFPYGKTGDFGAAACGQNIYVDAGSAFGNFADLHCFWDVYGPVFENAADVSIASMDAGWNAGNNGMELRGVISFWAHILSMGDESNTVDLLTIKPSTSDLVTHNATNYTAIADSIGIEPGVTAGWASYWSASGVGGAAWSSTQHYILGRNSANLGINNLFTLKGAKGLTLDTVGGDAANTGIRIGNYNSRENAEHGLYMTACRNCDISMDSVGDEIAVETTGACKSIDLDIDILNVEKQALIIGASALQFNVTGQVQNANSSATASTSAVDVNSTGRDINFNSFNIETANADYAFDIVASNNVALNNCDLTLTTTTAVGGSAPRIARNVGGYRTQNQGIGTIDSGLATEVISHGLAITPTFVEATGIDNAEVSALFITSVGATTFTVNAPAAVTANRTFYWRADGVQNQA